MTKTLFISLTPPLPKKKNSYQLETQLAKKNSSKIIYRQNELLKKIIE